MNSDEEYIDALRIQLREDKIRKGYTILLEYMFALQEIEDSRCLYL